MVTLAEHVGPIIGILGVCASIGGFFFWRMFTRLEEKMDRLLDQCPRREIDCMNRFRTKDDARYAWGDLDGHLYAIKEEIQGIREDLKARDEQFFRHSHGPNGLVSIR